VRTLQRWKPSGATGVIADQRPSAPRPMQQNQLSVQERQNILQICNTERFAQMPPSQIVPKLADDGIYLASESTFYRVLKKASQGNHRGRSREASAYARPKAHTAKKPNQVWSWDITLLPSQIRGQYFYLYMIQDVYSRYGVMWEVHECESGEYAADLVEKAVIRESCYLSRPILHSDNGSPMKCQTMRSKLYDLGIIRSHSRPGVSNDNPYIESFFKTLKYGPSWPMKGFESLEQARVWVAKFMQWYNYEHAHSKIQFVTPAQRHNGDEYEILSQRERVYALAKSKHPERWSGPTRNWTPIGPVTLNPLKQLSSEKTA